MTCFVATKSAYQLSCMLLELKKKQKNHREEMTDTK